MSLCNLNLAQSNKGNQFPILSDILRIACPCSRRSSENILGQYTRNRIWRLHSSFCPV